MFENKLMYAILTKKYGLLGKGILFLHDNIFPDTANSELELTEKLERFCLYLLFSHNLSPCDLFLFCPHVSFYRVQFHSSEGIKKMCKTGSDFKTKTFLLQA